MLTILLRTTMATMTFRIIVMGMVKLVSLIVMTAMEFFHAIITIMKNDYDYDDRYRYECSTSTSCYYFQNHNVNNDSSQLYLLIMMITVSKSSYSLS